MPPRPKKWQLVADLARIPELDSNAVGIRRMGVEDSASLGKLFFDAYVGTIDYEGETKQDAHHAIEASFRGDFGDFDTQASMVIERNGILVSATFITSWKLNPLLAFVVTAPSWQGRGLARNCTIASMRVLAKMGHRELRLFVTPGNEPATALYKRLGFSRVAS